MKNKKIIITEDGSHSIFMDELGEGYHSVHGAIQESRHVFIESGLHQFKGKKEISIFEAGFGTGLNAVLSMIFAGMHKTRINYEALELYPLDIEEAGKLNYPDLLAVPRDKFMHLHESPWGEKTEVTPGFSLIKIRADIATHSPLSSCDMIFFDAFSSEAQPNLWEKAIFMRLFNALNPGGILTTYSAKGSLRRILADVGFKVEKLAGPPGKRHITRAIKV